jgi:hypothetical protein
MLTEAKLAAERMFSVLDARVRQGHCHQKALMNMSAAHTALALGGYNVREAELNMTGK